MTPQHPQSNTEQTEPRSETPAQGTTKSVCAVLVAFFPDHEFEERLLTVLPQVESLVVVDNTPGGCCARRLKTLANQESHLHIIENQMNLGVAAALNQGLSLALNQGSQWLLTLDQDTVCYPDIVETLLNTRANCELAPTVIGGNYLDPRNGKNKVAEDRAGTWLEQKTVITSGCLVDVAMAHHIGGFRDNFFIDQVDHEFCLRMRAQGRHVVISRKPVMMHSVGEPDGPRLPFLGALPSHPPLRKYYITRNTLVTIAEYWRQEPEWCLRRFLRLLLGLALMIILEKKRLSKARAFAAGVVDSLHRRMGPCEHAHLNRTD
jgi:rhamnosyltransferase